MYDVDQKLEVVSSCMNNLVNNELVILFFFPLIVRIESEMTTISLHASSELLFLRVGGCDKDVQQEEFLFSLVE